MIERFQKFLYNITEIDLYWHRISSAVMGRYGLRGSQGIYFIKLPDAPQGLTSAQLAAACGKDKADVSRDLAALEKAGLLRRVGEGRAYRAPICLTEAGEAIARELKGVVAQAVDQVGDGLTDAEREIFYRALDLITVNLRLLSQSGLPDEKKENA